jgi:hypothetical protein
LSCLYYRYSADLQSDAVPVGDAFSREEVDAVSGTGYAGVRG